MSIALEKDKLSPSRFWSRYWAESPRPLVSMVFMAPMLVCYELSILFSSGTAPRNGADVWLRQFLDLLGFSQYFLLPLLTCGLLLAWHHMTQQKWEVRWDVCGFMLLESALFGFLLLTLAQWQGTLFASIEGDVGCSLGGPWERLSELMSMAGYFGAGIYEELLFRLMLLPALAALFRLSGASRGSSVVLSVLITSLLFSAAHYRIDFEVAQFHFSTAYGDAFDWYSFTFRFLAGTLFSLMFVFRGFGIAAGTHALYDIFAVLS